MDMAIILTAPVGVSEISLNGKTNVSALTPTSLSQRALNAIVALKMDPDKGEEKFCSMAMTMSIGDDAHALMERFGVKGGTGA